MGSDKRFVIWLQVAALASCLLLVVLTVLWGKSDKKLWLIGVIGVLILYTVAVAWMIVRYLKAKKEENAETGQEEGDK